MTEDKIIKYVNKFNIIKNIVNPRFLLYPFVNKLIKYTAVDMSINIQINKYIIHHIYLFIIFDLSEGEDNDDDNNNS